MPAYSMHARSTLANFYRSHVAHRAGLVLIWELMVILIAASVVPLLLAAASSSGARNTASETPARLPILHGLQRFALRHKARSVCYCPIQNPWRQSAFSLTALLRIALRALNFLWLTLLALLVAMVVLMITQATPGSAVRADGPSLAIVTPPTEGLVFELQINAHGCSMQPVDPIVPTQPVQGVRFIYGYAHYLAEAYGEICAGSTDSSR